jgi:DNA modification methylase
VTDLSTYKTFLKAKVKLDEECGFPCTPEEVNPFLKPHQRDIVAWAVRGGRRAVFAAFGLGKSLIQLEIVRLVLKKMGGGRALIVCPLNVGREFKVDAPKIGLSVSFIRSLEEASAEGIFLTNYETVRDGKLDPQAFKVISLDEASILRGFGGTKTFRELMATMAGDDRRDRSARVKTDGVLYRFVATATPSPNEFIELLAYAAFLGVMDVGQAKTRFFKRDSTKADQLTLHPHKEREFWLWVSSWAMFVQRPSDLGHSDEGYELPPLQVRWHEIATDHTAAGTDKNGQGRLLRNTALGVVDASREKRDSLPGRIAKLMEIRAEEPEAHRIIWHDLEDERRAIEAAVPGVLSVYGTQDLEKREQTIGDFSDGKFRELAAKPVIAGSGCNFQRYCSRAVFLGIGFKFNDFIQAVHRIQRFLQTKPVVIDLIYTEAERDVRRQLERKWEQHKILVANMTAIIRQYGLSHASLAGALERSLGVERKEASGKGWKVINNDCVEETAAMAPDSVGLIMTSIPFSTQYEYTPSFNDFGHTDDNDHFWAQMDFLIPQLLRVLQPGRIAAIHVKDRITPGGVNGFGFQTVEPFSDQCAAAFRKHGFAFLARKTITTDVVRENNQTYRLGWSEQCKDGSRMGCGMPEYVLLFRKPPTDRSNGYADVPVVKDKAIYTRARWQLDAHGFARSNGNRPLTAADLSGLPHEKVYKLFRAFSKESVYDFEHHVQLCESLGARLPVTFMLMPPESWHPDVWTDITRMRTLNGSQAAKGKEMHLCPLQFDIVDRVINQMSNLGDVVFDPFGGIGTVAYEAVKLGRQGLATELNPSYWADAVAYCRSAAADIAIPTLFDLEGLAKPSATDSHSSMETRQETV